MRLVDYEIVGNGQMDGFDWQLRAKLSLEDGEGNRLEEKAVYAISASSKKIIVRAEAGG